jgi:hypothetical protein
MIDDKFRDAPSQTGKISLILFRTVEQQGKFP